MSGDGTAMVRRWCGVGRTLNLSFGEFYALVRFKCSTFGYNARAQASAKGTACNPQAACSKDLRGRWLAFGVLPCNALLQATRATEGAREMRKGRLKVTGALQSRSQKGGAARMASRNSPSRAATMAHGDAPIAKRAHRAAPMRSP